MSIQITGHTGVNISQNGQIQAPQENVALFIQLLGSIQHTLNNAKTSMPLSNDPSLKTAAANAPVRDFKDEPTLREAPVGSLLENTALDVRNAETATSALQKEIRKNIHELSNNPTLDSSYVANITKEKFAAANNFFGVGLVSTNANDMSEEVSSLTRGR